MSSLSFQVRKPSQREGETLVSGHIGRNLLAHGTLVPAIKTAGMLVVYGNEGPPEKQVSRPK